MDAPPLFLYNNDMSYPIDNWKSLKQGYKFGEKTSYSDHHLGTDKIIPAGTPIKAPSNGVTTNFNGVELGKTVFFRPDGLDILIRFGHNSAFGKLGPVKKGDVIAISGNTGTLSTGAHSHIDISKHELLINDFNNFIDPDTFDWNYDTISDMDYKAKYEQEVKDHAEDIKEKISNYNNWQKELDLRKKLEQTTVPLATHEDIVRKLNTEIGTVTTERDNYRRGLNQQLSITEKIKLLLGV